MLTVKTILEHWLPLHGYDGLVCDGAECGCLVGDLIPCDGPCDTCRPGYQGPDPTGECKWMIYPTLNALDAAIAKAKGATDETP